MECNVRDTRAIRTLRARGASVLAGLFLTAFASSAGAVTMDMTAVFRPDSANPMKNAFKNTTPPGGYCKDHPEYCENGVFSIALPIRFRAIAPIAAMHDERQGAMVRVPSSWRDVSVTHEETGEVETVSMRVTGVGAAYTIKDPLPEGVWQSSWVNAPFPCQYGGVGYGHARYYAFFWRVPADAGVCAKQAQKDIPQDLQFAYENAGFSYELITPNPLKMSTGTYRGVLNYGVGPHRDFDMGDVMLPDDDLITLNFTLTVEHTLKVDIPPGGDRVELVPQGGWQAWLAQGRKPTRLFRDQTFNIASSGRFKMKLQCSMTAAQGCALQDSVTGRNAPMNTSVSLSHGLTDTDGLPVNRRLLKYTEDQYFQPGFYVDRKPGPLHFEIPPNVVDDMIQSGQSRHYSGSVTVIWDSEVG